MQKAYITALYDIMKSDNRVVSILSDSGTDYDELMAREMPDQCYNFGISEMNQVAAAAGMALCGKIPFVYTTGAFLAYRAAEFIRDDVCFQNANVKIVGMGSGLSWSTLGSTHHTLEDIAFLRTLPNLTLLSPASPLELKECVRAAYGVDGPVYIRMGMSGEREIFEQDDVHFQIGQNRMLHNGDDIAVFATGSIVSQALAAASLLDGDGITTQVINVSSLRPFDITSVQSVAKRASLVVSVEEHSVIGGLGSAIADAFVAGNLIKPLLKIGMHDTFAHGYGTHDEVLKANGLDSAAIYTQIFQYYGAMQHE